MALIAVLAAVVGFAGLDLEPEPTSVPRRSSAAPSSMDRVAPPPREPAPRSAAPGESDRHRGSLAPTVVELDEAFETFEEISMVPEVPREDGDAFDLEASQRMHQKTLALRTLVEMGQAGERAGSIDPEVVADRIDAAREQMALAIADIPLPSHLDDPDDIDAYRARMAQIALGVLDEGDPEDPRLLDRKPVDEPLAEEPP